MLKTATVRNRVEALSDDMVDVLLEEAERVLLEVDGRSDQAHQRLASADITGGPIAELRLAIAELADAYPSISHELEHIGERLHQIGPKSAIDALEMRPHILHLVRLSLQIHFLEFPTLEDYDAANRGQNGQLEDETASPAEQYENYVKLLTVLTTQLN